MISDGAVGRSAGPDDLRFAFGRNWQRFLRVVDEQRIAEAVASLGDFLGVADLEGLRFLDVGSGSGLSSLAARRLGAEVHSFDYDPDSVACTSELRRRFRPDDTAWVVEEGSVLDADYLAGLGRFDVVYSWGVLHHTGDLYRALDNVTDLVAEDGVLYLAIYNDPGPSTEVWRRIKSAYNRSGPLGRGALLAGSGMAFAAAGSVRRLIPETPRTLPVRTRPSVRGMTPWFDLVDWVGGYPYEAARPDALVDFYRDRGFELARLATCGARHGCNELLFRRRPPG